MTNVAFAQTVVTVDPAAKGTLGIVQVHTAQILETDDALEFGKGFFAFGGGTQVVTRGESVAGVNANADA